MELTQNNLLNQTHRGTDIYAFILAEHGCRPLSKFTFSLSWMSDNPFVDSKNPSLVVSLHQNMAVHVDLEQEDFYGDVFDFAKLHYKTDSLDQIYGLLNRDMNLGLLSENGPVSSVENPAEVWRPMISYFEPPIYNTLPSETLSLAEIHQRITDTTFEETTLLIRKQPDKTKRNQYKQNRLPYVTFSGTFASRSDSGLLESSELVVIDFDGLEDLEATRELLLLDPMFETELLFASPSGSGLKWVIKKGAHEHRKFFQGVYHYLKKQYGLEADLSGRDVARACFLCQDKNSYLNERHKPVPQDIERDGEVK